MAALLDFTIGYDSDPDALSGPLDITAGGRVAFTAGGIPASALTPTPIPAADTTIKVFVANGINVVAGAKVLFNIAYKIPA